MLDRYAPLYICGIILFGHSVSQVHTLVEDTDDLHISAVEHPVEQEVFAYLEAAQAV